MTTASASRTPIPSGSAKWSARASTTHSPGARRVAWESGTLGESARAKVPGPRSASTDEPVGEVSVGFAPASVFDELPLLLVGVALAALAAVALGALVSLVIRRRLERLTLGLQPEELVGARAEPGGGARRCRRRRARLRRRTAS